MNKNNIITISVCIVMALLLVGYSCKQKPARTYVIGLINPNPEAREGAKGFVRSMREYGYAEGENLTYIRHESTENMDEALEKMVAEKVDLIFTYSTPAAVKAKEITANTGTPVVFIVFDSLSSKLVKSQAVPSGNLTGVQLRGSTGKSLEWLSEVLPEIKNIFVPIAFDTAAASQSLEALKKVADKLDIRITLSEVTTVEELRTVMSSMPEDIDAVFILHSFLIDSNVEIIIDEAIKRKLPVASSGHEHHKIGALLCYGPQAGQIGSQAARLANRILQGINPSTLPVENAEYALGINLRTAQTIGMEIPDSILKQADNLVR